MVTVPGFPETRSAPSRRCLFWLNWPGRCLFLSLLSFLFLLRRNSHNINVTIIKQTVQAISTFTMLYNHYLFLVRNHFCHSKGNIFPISSYSSFPTVPQSLGTTICLLSPRIYLLWTFHINTWPFVSSFFHLNFYFLQQNKP